MMKPNETQEAYARRTYEALWKIVRPIFNANKHETVKQIVLKVLMKTKGRANPGTVVSMINHLIENEVKHQWLK